MMVKEEDNVQKCRNLQTVNYYPSLDKHDSTFSKKDAKAMTIKALIEEVRGEGDRGRGKVEGHQGVLMVEMEDETIHKQVLRLLLVAAKKQVKKAKMV